MKELATKGPISHRGMEDSKNLNKSLVGVN